MRFSYDHVFETYRDLVGSLEMADGSNFGFSKEAQDLVREEVGRKLPLLNDYSDEQLLAEISPFEYGSELASRGRTPEGAGMVSGNPAVGMPQAGFKFLSRGEFHDVICEEKNKEMLKDLLQVGVDVNSVTVVVTAVLSLMGIAAPIVVPAAVVALAVILLRRGIDSYCSA